MRPISLMFLALLLVPVVKAQDSARVVLFEGVVVPGQDSMPTVKMLQGTVYRMELSRSEVRPSLVPKEPGDDIPYVIQLSNPDDGPVLYEIQAFDDGLYGIVLTGGAGLRTRVVLSADLQSTGEVRKRMDSNRLAIGLMVEAGFHSGYLIGGEGDVDAGGSINPLVNACLLVTTGHRLNICLGVGRHFRSGSDNSLFVVFAEPRFAIVRRTHSDGNITDVGISAWIAQGSASRESIDPSIYAGGIYVAHSLYRNRRGRGTGISLSMMYGSVGNVAVPHESILQVAAGFFWLP